MGWLKKSLCGIDFHLSYSWDILLSKSKDQDCVCGVGVVSEFACFLMLILWKQLANDVETRLDAYYYIEDYAFLIVSFTASYVILIVELLSVIW